MHALGRIWFGSIVCLLVFWFVCSLALISGFFLDNSSEIGSVAFVMFSLSCAIVVAYFCKVTLGKGTIHLCQGEVFHPQ